MLETAPNPEPKATAIRRHLSRFLFPKQRSRKASARAANAAAAGTPTAGTATAGTATAGTATARIEAFEDESSDTQDAELIVAVFRTVILLVVILAPELLGLSSQAQLHNFWLAALASVYNIGAMVACLYPHRFGLRRPFIVLMDVMLITTWIHLSDQWDLFPFYYIVVVVAAMWFRVVGGMLTALACNILYLLIWNRFTNSDPEQASRLTLEMLLLALVGCVTGYIAKAQERERRRRLANQLLVARYQHEIDISAQLQPLLVSSAWMNEERNAVAGSFQRPHPCVEVGAAMQTARVGCGGDYFDLISLKDERVALCIADVSGKSVRAQARLPLLKYALRALAPLYPQPDQLLAQLNETLRPDLQPDFYIALCYVVLDPKRRILSWCNAGHMAPLLLPRQDRETAPGSIRKTAESAVSTAVSKIRRDRFPAPSTPAIPLASPGPPLGLFEDAHYTAHTLSWQPGDELLLFTDGLPDTLDSTDDSANGASADDARDGEERVRELAYALAGHFDQSAQDIAQEFVRQATGSTLLSESTPATPGTSQAENNNVRDDVTIVFVRYQEVADGEVPSS